MALKGPKLTKTRAKKVKTMATRAATKSLRKKK